MAQTVADLAYDTSIDVNNPDDETTVNSS